MKIFSLVKEYIFEQKINFIIYILLCLFFGIISIILPVVNGRFIDTLLEYKSIKVVTYFCAILIGLFVVKLLIGYIVRILYAKLEIGCAYKFNFSIIKHIQRLPYIEVQKMDMIYLNKIINSDANALIIYSLSVVQEFILQSISFVLPSMVLFYLNKPMFLFCVLSMVLYCLTYFLIRKKVYRISRELAQASGDFFSKMQEQYDFIYLCKIFSFFENIHDRLNINFQKMKKLTIMSQKLGYIFGGIEDTISMVCQIFIFYYGGVQIINGNFTFGMFTIYSSYVSMILSSLKYFFDFGKNYQEVMGSYDRIRKLLDIEEEKVGNLKLDKIDSINLIDISFAYDTKVIFEKMNYTFSKGNIYAVLGENGAGKSTLLNILLGIYKTKSGSVLYNFTDISSVDLVYARENFFAVAPQMVDLFEDSILYNLMLTQNLDEKVKEERFSELIKMLNLEKICQKESSQVSENETSRGERQKIALLRVFLKNSDVIILDEPTTALDKITTNNLLKFLLQQKEKKIIIIITHDDRIVDICDYVIDI